MNWPTAITICICAICATLITIGIMANRDKSSNESNRGPQI